MSRVRKKIEKRAAQLLIKATIFNRDDYCPIENRFYSSDYYGEYTDINPWYYLYELAVESAVEYVVVNWDDGTYKEYPQKRDLSIIEAIKIFKRNYL